MNRTHIRGIIDLVLAACVLYLSVWLYEAGNYLALYLGGSQATLVLNGFFPAGVVAVGGSTPTGAAKLLQVAVVMGVIVPAYAALRKSPSVTLMALLSVMAVYLTSFYWEFLSLVGPIPMLLHATIFALLSLTAMVALVRADPRLKRLLW